jgi:hypothetical protein
MSSPQTGVTNKSEIGVERTRTAAAATASAAAAAATALHAIELRLRQRRSHRRLHETQANQEGNRTN